MRIFYAILTFCILTSCLLATNPPGDHRNPGRPGSDTHDKDRPKTQIRLDGQIRLQAGFSRAVLKTANGCGISNFVMTCSGDSALNQAPTIWACGSESGGTYLSNSIPAQSVLGVAFRREQFPENTSVIQTFDPQAPYVVITERGLFSYRIPNDYILLLPDRIALTDSILIPGILMAAQEITKTENNPFVLCVADSAGGYSLRFHAYPSLLETHRSTLPFRPELMEMTEEGLYVVGKDSSGMVNLLHYSATQDSLLHAYPLNDSAFTPRELIQAGPQVFILSTPGDSMTMLTTLDSASGNFTQAILLAQSGIRATHNEFQNAPRFTFQLLNDAPTGYLERQIRVLDPFTLAMSTFVVDRQLDYFKHPETQPWGFGRFDLEWIGGKWTGTTTDSVFIPRWGNVLQLPTGCKPSFVDASYGCWIHVEEGSGEGINFSHYPNPTSGTVTIHLTGLTKGKNYKVDLLDAQGRQISSFSVDAYQKVELLLPELAPGVYFLRLDTGNSQLVKEILLYP